MLKHRGFPSRLRGSDFHFTIRRDNKSGPTPLIARERYADRRPADKRADSAFLGALWEYFGDAPFQRGNLDAGRLSWLWQREVVAGEDPFDAASYDAWMRLDVARAQVSYPQIFSDASNEASINQSSSRGGPCSKKS